MDQPSAPPRSVSTPTRDFGASLPRQRAGSYRQEQRSRTLGFTTWVVLIAALVLGTFDIQFRTWPSVLALYALAALCVPVFMLNQHGHYAAAAALLSVIALLVANINLLDGDGVHDPGLVAYPILIMVGTLFFGRRSAPYFSVGAALSVALVVAAEVLGWIHPTIGPTRFSILIPIVTLLGAAAGIIWTIIGNMEKDLQKALESELELSKNYDLTLEAWAKVMEYRDRETEGHSRRLVDLATKLAHALGLDEEHVEQLQRGALLHDIGKLAVPDEILLKPAALDEREQHIMQKHPVYAKQMLDGIPFLRPAVAVAYSHHERWDGQGYPEGLKGEEIPLSARLFAVIDTWDALNSERVYRAAWPSGRVKAYIRENAGLRFDPHIVDIFLKMVK